MPRRRVRVVSSSPDTYQERLGRQRLPEGGVGQFVQSDSPLTSVVDISGLADSNGLGGIYGVPEFLWIDGDGNAPTIGTGLAVTGAPVPGQGTPWQRTDGTDVTAEELDGASYRTHGVPITLGATEDQVTAALIYLGAVSNHLYFATRGAAGGGFRMAYAGGTSRFIMNDAGGGVTSIGIPVSPNAWLFVVGVANRDGNIIVVNNGVLGGVAACPGGDISGSGIGIGSTQVGAQRWVGKIAWCAIWKGVGLNEVWRDNSEAQIMRLTSSVVGCDPRQGDPVTCSRASTASWLDSNGVWRIAARNLPRAGDPTGLRVAPARTNLAYNNINPSVTTGWSVSGGVLSVVDDSAALAAGGAEEFGPNAIQVANATGGPVYLHGGATTGNTNPHSLSALARLTAGAGAEIGFWDVSGATFTAKGALLDGYATRTLEHNETPPDTDSQFAIHIPDNATVRVVAMQCEAGTRTTTPIPNAQTAATQARVIETFDTPVDPSDAQGSVEAIVTPLDWSGTDLGTDCRVITRAGGASGILIAEDGTGGLEIQDGTNTVTEATNPLASGNDQTVRVRWHENGGMSVDVDGERTDGNYDGALQSTGVVRVAPDLAEVAVKELTLYRNGSG